MSTQPEDLGPIDHGDADRAVAIYRYILEQLNPNDVGSFHPGHDYAVVASTLTAGILAKR